MHLALSAVLEFHKKMAQTIGDPRNPDITQDQALRLELLKEELLELEEALEAGDVVETADALADLAYVLVGAAITWGIDIASVFDEVHRSNMTKKPGNKRADGKILKDSDFSPPNVRGVLDECAENCDPGPDSWWEEPSELVTQKIMLAAKDQAKILATKMLLGTSDGIPQAITGQLTNYGAYIFDCSCGRRLATQVTLGTRGGKASSGSCECMCGEAYTVDFSGESPLINQRKV